MQEGEPLQDPRVGSCLTPGSCLGRHVPTKQETLLGRGAQVESRRVREPSSATWLAVSGFMVMQLVSRLSLPNHSDSGSLLVVHAHHSVRMDSSEKDSGRLVRHMG